MIFSCTQYPPSLPPSSHMHVQIEEVMEFVLLFEKDLKILNQFLSVSKERLQLSREMGGQHSEEAWKILTEVSSLLDASLVERCPHFRRCCVQVSMELGPEHVERCPHFRGCCVQVSIELGPEDVSLLERCPHFGGCYVQASMLGPEDMSLLERCPHFRYITVRYRVQGIYAIQKPEGHRSDPSAARALHGPRVFELRRSRRTRYLTCLVHSTRV